MKRSIINERCKATRYESQSGADEYFFVLEAESGKNFTESLLQLNADMTEALLAFELTEKTTVFARFYLSDMPNQREELLASPIFAACSGGAHSVIEQPPPGHSICCLACPRPPPCTSGSLGPTKTGE